MSFEQFATDIEEFITVNWTRHQDESRWWAAVEARGWRAADWPADLGGTGWSRREQWLFLELTSKALCPLPDDRFTVIAPLLIALGSESQQGTFLPLLLASSCWRFAIMDDASRPPNRDQADIFCLLDDSNSLFIVDEPDSRSSWSLLGIPGQGRTHLATHQSAFLILAELKTSLELIHTARQTSDIEPDNDTAMLTLEIQTMEGLFLAGQKEALITLRSQELRTRSIELLHDCLGYYGLAAPDAVLASNEPPLPFEAERNHLEFLRRQLARDTHLLKDNIFEQLENG